jgi:chromosome segregation ATPase
VPRQDGQAQRARDTDRRRILQEELQSADKQLAVARQKLAEQETVRNGNERNYERVLERLKPFQDEVRVAEENVVSLKRELSNLR